MMTLYLLTCQSLHIYMCTHVNELLSLRPINILVDHDCLLDIYSIISHLH
jgi:hypothetical protein